MEAGHVAGLCQHRPHPARSLSSSRGCLSRHCVTGSTLSADAGLTWKGMGKGIGTFFVTDIVQPRAGVLVVSTRDKGLYRSTDDGVSFCSPADAGNLV